MNYNNSLFAKTADFFKVLGDKTRMRIVCTLLEGEMCVCDICAALGMTKSAVSHQLATLKDAHFVTCRRAGKHIYYRLADAHIEHIVKDALFHVSEPEENVP